MVHGESHIKALNATIGFKLKKYEDLHCQMCCDCLWYCEGIHLFIYDWQPLATWRPGDRTGDLATSWRLLATSGRQETRIGTGDFCWRPLATTGDHWRPGDLATWRPAGDLLATSAGDLATRGPSLITARLYNM